MLHYMVHVRTDLLRALVILEVSPLVVLVNIFHCKYYLTWEKLITCCFRGDSVKESDISDRDEPVRGYARNSFELSEMITKFIKFPVIMAALIFMTKIAS